MWISERGFTKEEIHDHKAFTEGFYIFGGIDSNGDVKNDLWVARPNYSINKQFISV